MVPLALKIHCPNYQLSYDVWIQMRDVNVNKHANKVLLSSRSQKVLLLIKYYTGNRRRENLIEEFLRIFCELKSSFALLMGKETATAAQVKINVHISCVNLVAIKCGLFGRFFFFVEMTKFHVIYRKWTRPRIELSVFLKNGLFCILQGHTIC